MRYRILLTLFLSILMFMGCIQEPVENPEGKYGTPVDTKKGVALRDILDDKGMYLNHEIVIKGQISSINEQVGITTFEIIDNGILKCATEKFKLPKSLDKKIVFVQGILKEIQVSSKKGRDVGGEYTLGADPLGSSYQEELRLDVTGIQVAEIYKK